MTRFVTPLREDYGFVLLILALFFFKVREGLEVKRLNVLYITVMGFIFASSVVVHLLPSLFLFVLLALNTVYYWFKKETTLMKENISILLASCVFISYYVVYLEESLAWFIGVVFQGGVFLLLIPALSVVFMWYASRIVHKSPEVEQYRRLGVLLSLLIIFFNLFFTSEKSAGFNALTLDMFSSVILLIGLYELLSNQGKVPLCITSIVMATGFFISFSYVGVVVPIGRFSVYLSWVAVYLCSGFLSRLLSMNIVHMSSLQIVEQLRSIKPEGVLLVALVLITSLGGALQTRQYPYYFNESDISDTRVFNSLVRADDLIIPQESLRHLLYYTETDYECLVTGEDNKEFLIDLYSANSPVELSDIIASTFPDKRRAVFFTTMDRYPVYTDPFVNRNVLEKYCREYTVGHVMYFTMDIPYVENNIPVERIRSIDVDESATIFAEGLGSGAVTSFSNLYVGRDGRYYLLYTTDEGLWSAVNVNGEAWANLGTRLLDGRYLNPYIVDDDGMYYLFVEDPSLGVVASYISEDGYQWSGRREIGGPPPDHLYYWTESPVAWVEKGTLYVIFWETVVADEVLRSGLRCLESRDGVSWRDAESSSEWRLFSDMYYPVEYSKIILSEAFSSEGELVYVGRYLSKDEDGSYSWKLGSFKPDTATGSQRVFLSTIDVYSYGEQVTVGLCRVLRDTSEARLDFFVMFESGYTGIYKGNMGDR
ncbi:hypothetical protein E2P65_01280 [Candidatus Bathyarchaeota archaeon]|nr:hypothetical protein E2P65_01280 [Candidatus Bathyarchaeota archaeon]